MKKLLVSSLLFIMGLLTFVQAAEKTTIEVACYPPFDEGFRQILPDFYKTYPNIEVKLKVAGYGDHHNTLVTSVAAGEGVPDVTVIELGYIPHFVAEGGLADLYQKPYFAKKFKKQVVTYTWAQGTTDDGCFIAFPLEASPGCAYWRRDIFAEIGINIEDIKTMDDLFIVAGKFTRDTDGDGKIDHWFLSNAENIAWMILHSKKFMCVDGYEIKWDFDYIKSAFDWAKRFHDAGYSGDIKPWSDAWYKAFQEGIIAYEPSGDWLGWHLRNWMAPNTIGKWGVARWPALYPNAEPMAGYWGGSFLAIPNTSKHKKEAWKYIRHICTDKENQLKLYQTSNAFPAYIPTWSDPYFNESQEFFAGQFPRKIWIDVAKEVPPITTSKIDNLANAVIDDELNRVIYNGKDINQALKEINAEVCFDRKPRGQRKSHQHKCF